MTIEQKAKDLVNMFYGCNAKTQFEAIEQAERTVLTKMCQLIDGLNMRIDTYDLELIKSEIRQLKWQQELAAELDNMKNALSV